MDIDFAKEPIGKGKGGKDVFLKDIWPSSEEIAKVSGVTSFNMLVLIQEAPVLSLRCFEELRA